MVIEMTSLVSWPRDWWVARWGGGEGGVTSLKMDMSQLNEYANKMCSFHSDNII